MRLEHVIGAENPRVAPGISDFSIAADAQPDVRQVARKEFLPRRSGESRFAPPQYFYTASKSSALPIEADSRQA
jgi:hypothetical protein